MLLACGRRIVSSRRVLEDSSANARWDFTPVIPIFRMGGKTLGIIGCGRIGSLVLLKLKSFGFKFLICDPYLTEERKRELGIETVPLETLLRESDYVTIHTPLTPETRCMINARTLALMKPTAYLVNTARGPMVDHAALAGAIERKVIAGAGIDVFDVEPPPPSYPLFPLRDAILTPHLAWYAEEGAWRIRELIVLEVDRYLAGQPPRYIAKPQ